MYSFFGVVDSCEVFVLEYNLFEEDKWINVLFLVFVNFFFGFFGYKYLKCIFCGWFRFFLFVVIVNLVIFVNGRNKIVFEEGFFL